MKSGREKILADLIGVFNLLADISKLISKQREQRASWASGDMHIF